MTSPRSKRISADAAAAITPSTSGDPITDALVESFTMGRMGDVITDTNRVHKVEPVAGDISRSEANAQVQPGQRLLPWLSEREGHGPDATIIDLANRRQKKARILQIVARLKIEKRL